MAASPPREATTKGNNGSDGEDPFLAVFRAELDEIRLRRERFSPGRPSLAADAGVDSRKPSTGYGLTGLALSGGGIRSAAVCLGAVQALATREVNAIDRIDYLSTVSGGGYIGAAMAAGMAEGEGAFPFPSELGKAETKGLRKIRDFSNFLLVGGFVKTLRSVGSIVAGVMANIVAVIPVILVFAGLTILTNPAREDLRQALPVFGWLNLFGFTGHFAYSLNLFLISAILAAALVFVTAAAWSRGDVAREKLRALWIALLIIPLTVALLELQPYAVRRLWNLLQFSDRQLPQTTGRAFLEKSLPILTAISAVMAAFSTVLGKLLRDGKSPSGWRSALAGLRRMLVYLLAGLVVPLLIWFVYLTVSRWGIAEQIFGGRVVCKLDADLAFGGPHWLDSFLCRAADFLPFSYAPGAQVFLLLGAAGILLWYLTPPNAYSLHSLYRDKISRAFLRYYPLGAPAGGADGRRDLSARKLSGLKTEYAPYHLLNAALNIHGSQRANERGRNADFFIFSKCFIGSRLTGWCSTGDLEAFAPSLDLGTAVTVSGAAVTANVGAKVNRAIVFSLAMLNIRLGYWLANPFRLKSGLEDRSAKAWGPMWFLREAFGVLNEESRLVFLTDGGHMENLGLYELLRRRCRCIIVVDAEADPAMVMPSFIQAQRFARIDLGVRIEIEWSEISRGTLEYDPRKGQNGPHAAIGTIHYDADQEGASGEKGILIYVKSSLSGDENDYVREYRRRNSGFPQEGTFDQFFSEEQFEAYRALGFHMVHRLFTGVDAFQGPNKERDRFAALAKTALMEDLGCETPLVWSGRAAEAAA